MEADDSPAEAPSAVRARRGGATVDGQPSAQRWVTLASAHPLLQAPPPTAAAAGASKPAAKTRKTNNNVRSLADLTGGDDDSDDEDRPIETFIGGAKRHVHRETLRLL